MILWCVQRRYLSLTKGKKDNKDEYCKFFKNHNYEFGTANPFSAESHSSVQDKKFNSY